MATIGVLFGMENVFPGALVERINAMGVDGITAEFVHIGGVKMDGPCPLPGRSSTASRTTSPSTAPG